MSGGALRRNALWRWLRVHGGVWMRAIVVIAREIKQGGLDYRAMSLVYTSLLAFVPLLAVSFSVMKAFGGERYLEPLLLELFAPLGENAAAVTASLLDSVKRLNVGLLGFLGFALLFYTSVALLDKIEESFNHIWRSKASRNLLRRFGDYLSFILMGPLLVFSVFGSLAGLVDSKAHGRHLDNVADALQQLGHLLLPYAFVIAAFTFVYRYIPNARVKVRAALFGGALAGLLWKGAGWLFSEVVAGSAQYHAVYSSFAILVLFMVWLYVSWLIVLLGVQVSFYYQHPRYFRYRSAHVRLGPRAFERVGLTIMWLVARRFVLGEPAWDCESLADRLDLPEDCVDDLLSVLEQAGMVMPVDAEGRFFVPARDLTAITLRDLLERLRAAHEDNFQSTHGAAGVEPIDAFCSSLDQAIGNSAGDTTLRELVAFPEPMAANVLTGLS